MNSIFYIHDIMYLINEFIKDDNNLFNCNRYLKNLKLKYYKLNKINSIKFYNDLIFMIK